MPTRRHLLKSIVAGAAAAAAPVGLRRVQAATDTEKRLVIVLLRGGMDGLAAVAPYGDASYRRQRGDLALAAPGQEDGLVDLDGFFGLHPSLEPLHALYKRGELAIAHAVGIPYRGRSHFDAQNVLENGTVAPHSTADGWLNRALAAVSQRETPAGLSVGASVPLIMRGDARYTTYAPQVLPVAGADFLNRIEAMYQQDPVLAKTFAEAQQARAMKAEVLGSGKGRIGGDAYFKEAFGAAGKLLADPTGPRIAILDTDGWDTHAYQGTTGGPLAIQFANLAVGLSQLRDGLAASWRDSVVVVVTEFGRTAATNGSNGSDHGTGAVALLLGGAVRGGRMVTPWPGLATRHLFEGRDLAPATDMRAILKGVLRDHLQLPERHIEDHVFPDSRAVGGLPRLVRT
jgi:uncharacterized protein (DUF1501 family)